MDGELMTEGEFTFPTELQSYTIHYDSHNEAIISTVNLKIYFTGNIKFYINANGTSTFYEIPNLKSGVWKTFDIPVPGANVGYYIIGESGSTIFTLKDANNNIIDPAITIEMF